MKLVTTYLLLFTYSTIILKPLLPYTSDILAHIFWYKDHIATVHSHHGKFHVHKEIIDAAKSTNSEKNSTTLKKDFSANDHIVSKELNISNRDNFDPRYFCSTFSLLIYTYLNSDYPPPKV